MIVVMDYGMGNLRSVSKALELLGASAKVSGDPDDLARADKLVLPGQGAFHSAMQQLRAADLLTPLQQAIARGIPCLGICLGLQLLLDSSEEGGGSEGLSFLPGKVRRFPQNIVDQGLKIPHMGWNQVSFGPGARSKGKSCPLLEGIPEGSFFYFVHSYYADPQDNAVKVLESDYGVRFTAMVWKDNVFATQFHPEKSQAAGLQLLKNFVNL